MDTRDLAVELKHNGHNCAQAVLCAFKDMTGLTGDQLDMIGAAFGGGMGCMEGTCGALCGAEMLLGLLRGEKRIGRDAADIHRAFSERCGASICKELKGVGTGRVLCECDDCVRNAVDVLKEKLHQLTLQ